VTAQRPPAAKLAGNSPSARQPGWHGPTHAIAATDWDRAVTVINESAEICLACHIRPDADALGSMLAVLLALRQRGGQKLVASFGEQPLRVPAILRFLPGTELLADPDEVPGRAEVMITFDAASPDRLGVLQDKAAAAGELIVVDHHVSNTRFGTVNLVDPRAAATAMLAAELISRLDVELTRDAAFGIYAGLVTDTGSFKYPATSPDVHELAARLLRTGIEPGAVARELWDRAPFGYLSLLGAALCRARLEPAAAGGHGMVWTTVDSGDRAEAGLPLEAAEGVIDVIRRTDEADVAVVLKESDDGTWLVSARSKGKADVGRACTALGGGGHPQAAGFTATGTADEAIGALRSQLAVPGGPDGARPR
jgi:phosphoesterase RecJ-like protein